jgi:hypothetical protein
MTAQPPGLQRRFVVTSEEWSQPLLADAIRRWLQQTQATLVITCRSQLRKSHERWGIDPIGLQSGSLYLVSYTTPAAVALRSMCRVASWHGTQMFWSGFRGEVLLRQPPAVWRGRALEAYDEWARREAWCAFDFVDGDVLCYGVDELVDLQREVEKFGDLFAIQR